MNLKSAHTGKIGKAFINARMLRSMTQEKVATLTFINLDYIKAIESGDYAIFPARIFAVQYFEKYAKFLNLEINFFDIYNAEVVAAAEKEDDFDSTEKSFLKKNIISIIFTFFIFLTLLIFIFQSNHNTSNPAEITSQETSSNLDDFEINIESNFSNDINELHNKINRFFIKDKLDSLQLDVTVDSSEPEA
tara:strand:+ start:2099 stop:2671 length:573 start_codon:yes stop_codon:yes gene_type:complete